MIKERRIIMNKYFHGFLMGVSVLPALAIMPAMAEYTDIINIQNDTDLVITENVNITNQTGHGILVSTPSGDATYPGSILTINADSVIVSANRAAIWAQHRTENGPNDDPTKILITADIIDLIGQNGGGSNSRLSDGYGVVSAMSQGIIELKGDTTITANPNLNNDAILARGNAVVKINENTTDKTTKINGNIDFNYNSKDSGSTVNANVDVTLNGTESYWNGNTVMSYDDKKNATKMHQNETTVRLKNGAEWNATQISDIETDTDGGYFYTALNNLNIDNGTVNIADTTRGIVVENANIKDATFNGGKLNIGAMTLSGGTNTFNNNVVGIDNASALTIANDATMNIGTNTVNVNNITLDGTLLATLRDGDAQITAGTFGGNGTLKLSLAGAGTYHVFGDSTFRAAGIDATSSVYDISWANEDKDLVATLKSVEDIAAENGIQEDTAAAIAGVAQSTSEKLNDLAVKMQEKLAEDTAEAKQEVEKAAAAVHPEKESVAQSIAASVQTTVANLTGARMRMVAPRIGRNGGDVRLTGGGVWAQGLFNKSKQNDAFSGYTRGIAAGMDGTINNAWTIGAGYSYAHSDISGTGRDTEIDSNTIFVYGQYKPTQWYVNAVLNYTMSDFSEEGVVMGTPVTGDYDVNSFGGVIATGYDFASGVTPELGLRYMHVMADDYTNSMDVKTKSKDTDFLTGVFGAKYAFGINMDRYTKLIPQLNAAVKYDMLSDRNISTVTMPGVDSYTLRGERLSRLGGEFGIGLGLKYKTLDFSINYDIDVRKDYTSQTGMLKFRYNF